MKDLHDLRTKKRLHSGVFQTFLMIFARSSKECQTGIASRPCTNCALRLRGKKEKKKGVMFPSIFKSSGSLVDEYAP
jgi:hypothetical protein